MGEMSPGWDELMTADKLGVAHDLFDDALGWANARASERRRRQRMYAHEINGGQYWVIRDAAPSDTDRCTE